MNYQITGTIKRLTETETVESRKEPGKSWPKRVLVVEELGEQYPNVAAIEFFGDTKVGKLDGLEEGQTVTAHFNVNANEGRDGRWWPKLSGWKVDAGEKSDATQAAPAGSSGGFGGPEDDAPFASCEVCDSSVWQPGGPAL